jgi:hypothetical protein
MRDALTAIAVTIVVANAYNAGLERLSLEFDFDGGKVTPVRR